jgi:hypothetical protein
MGNKGKVGRPKVADKGPLRSVVSDPEIERYAKEHPEINWSHIFRTSARAIMPMLGLDDKIEKTEKEIDDLKAELAIKEAYLNDLQREKAQREAMALEIKIEADCHAYYLHTLIKEGRIKTILPVRPTSDAIIDLIKRNYGEDSVLATNGALKLNIEAKKVKFNVMPIRLFLGRNGIIIDREYNITLDDSYFKERLELDSPSAFSNAFRVSIGEFDRFKTDYLAGLLKDSPIDALKDYKPEVWGAVKESVKEKLRQQYKAGGA